MVEMHAHTKKKTIKAKIYDEDDIGVARFRQYWRKVGWKGGWVDTAVAAAAYNC